MVHAAAASISARELAAGAVDHADLRTSQTVTAIERAADILLHLADSRRPDSGITEISRDLGISKAVVHRVLASLRSRDLVDMDLQTRRYSLGPRALMLGLTYLDRIDARRLEATRLAPLSEATSETATLSLRPGNSRFYVDQVIPPREVIMTVRLGVPYPLHAGASSKAFLAFLDDRDIYHCLAGPLARLTESTIISKRALRQELVKIRARGWADSAQERQPGAASVAAPVFDYSGVPKAVMSVCGPADRFREHAESCRDTLLQTTRTLSAQLGYSGARPLP